MKLFMILLVTFTLNSCSRFIHKCWIFPEEGAWEANPNFGDRQYFETKEEAENYCSDYLHRKGIK